MGQFNLRDLRTIIRIVSGIILIIAIGMAYRFLSLNQDASVVIEWTTASEVNTAGFNLYRSENPQGPYEKVNDNLIPASDDPLLGDQYTYEDANVEAGKTYYYQLEDVELTGSTASHGPIEVVARQHGNLELVLAFLFAALGLLGLMMAPRFF